MASVPVEIVAYTQDHQPGFVACRMVDADECVWLFEEKVPVVTDEHLHAASRYPCVGSVGCEVLGRDGDRVRVGVSTLCDYRECWVRASVLKE